jgi:hypothetical protein
VCCVVHANEGEYMLCKVLKCDLYKVMDNAITLLRLVEA